MKSSCRNSFLDCGTQRMMSSLPCRGVSGMPRGWRRSVSGVMEAGQWRAERPVEAPRLQLAPSVRRRGCPEGSPSYITILLEAFLSATGGVPVGYQSMQPQEDRRGPSERNGVLLPRRRRAKVGLVGESGAKRGIGRRLLGRLLAGGGAETPLKLHGCKLQAARPVKWLDLAM